MKFFSVEFVLENKMLSLKLKIFDFSQKKNFERKTRIQGEKSSGAGRKNAHFLKSVG